MKLLNAFIVFIGLAFLAGPAVAKNDKDKSDRALPPGLQKKVDRGGQLPPGWEKKVVVGKPLDEEVYRQKKIIAPVDEKGRITIEVGGKMIRLIEATREVIEVLN